jgi:hypothetical protein
VFSRTTIMSMSAGVFPFKGVNRSWYSRTGRTLA